ncbi:MAG: DUF2244 domain-containing protein [Wenzhouxiangellaceae bacterium]
MVRQHSSERAPEVRRIEVLSNLSLTLDHLAAFFLVLSGVTLTVALLPTLLGYWPVMAIAVIHLLIVGWCFRLAWRGHWARQDIEVDAREVRITSTTARTQETVRWPVGWVRVHQRRLGGETKAYLAHHQQRLEIGRFVPEAERLEAARLIARALEPYSAWREPQFK